MAPALTQASDPQTFHVTAHHHSPSRPGEAPVAHTSAPPTTHLALQYGGLKEPPDCTDAHLTAALTNGTRRLHHLPPSPPLAGGLACGREGCDPPSRPHAAQSTMDLPSGAVPPMSEESLQSSGLVTGQATAMGQNTLQQSTDGVPAVQDLGTNKTQRPLSQDGDLLALIGRDFANMNEIIDTLTRLADNPEVIAAVDTAALDLAHASQPQPVEVQVAVPQVSKEERSQLLINDLSRRQWQIERRQARLLRRLRRVTARGLGASVSGQIRELLDHSQSALAQQKNQMALSEDKKDMPGIPEMSIESLRADTMKGMSTSALISLVRRVEASQGLARLAAVSHRPSRKQPAPPAPALPETTRAEVSTVVTEFQSSSHGHTHHDSDATESSSGGESCDEMDGFNDNNTQHAHVRDRAYYRYLRARSWVASRWTWLQAQIADLEYRILQQHKIYTHVRNTKGAVQVEEGSRWRGLTLRDPAHLDLHDPALTCLAAPIRTTVNGYHGRVEDSVAGGIPDASFTSARTQGVRTIKRRRLVRAGAGLCAGHRRGGGGGRIPAVQCKCVPPLTCVLCTRLQGAVPPAAPPDPDTQPSSERHARVDPTFHPVLTQPTDVSISEQFDALLKTTDWQKQVLTAKTVPPLPVVNRIPKKESPKVKKKKDKDRKKENKKSKKEGKGRIMLKIRKSHLTSELVRDADVKKKRQAAQEALLTIKKVRVEEDDDTSSVYGSSIHSSPSASPAPIDRSAHKKQSSSSSSNQKNKPTSSGHSYDIDNIVIPYSMAASTRVEKLEYKEIPTPKWRIVPLIPNHVHHAGSGTSQEEEFDEDISEEAIAARHGRSEELERKKFLQYLHMQVTSRSSRSRRTDSSGTNTPDHPLSPRPQDPTSDTISPMATPPATPLAPSEDSNQSSSLPTVPSINSSTLITSVPPSMMSSTTSQPSNSSLPEEFQGISSSSQPSTLLVHYPQVGLNSSDNSVVTSTATAGSLTTASISSSLALLTGARRTRTFSSGSRSRGLEDGMIEKLEGVEPYEKRIFPLNDSDYFVMVKNSEACDTGLMSPILDTSIHEETNNVDESGRSSPMSEVTDSAPEDEGNYDDSAEPKWTISGLKDASGQCVLQIHRN